MSPADARAMLVRVALEEARTMLAERRWPQADALLVAIEARFAGMDLSATARAVVAGGLDETRWRAMAGRAIRELTADLRPS